MEGVETRLNNISGLFDLTDSIAVITGAGKGIGKAMASALASKGATVVIVDLDDVAGMQTAEEICDEGMSAIYKPADVTCALQVERTAKDIIKQFGKLDILINNAGTVVRKTILDTTEDEWDRVIDTNLKGAFLMSRAVGPFMVENRKGKIINIGSVSSYLGHPERGAYSSSKGGILMLTKVMAVELGQYGINVNGIAPGYIRTPMTATLMSDKQKYNHLISKIPLGRIGETSDLVGPVIFLASTASDYVHGHMLLVDGGRTAD